jgi:cob(I)alamin adenosyltransferase
MENDKKQRHNERMARKKAVVDAGIENAQEERGIIIVITGNGKGKSTSAFGTMVRALGYDHKVGLVQFIKGTRDTGEVAFLRNIAPEMPYYAMGTGFTWDTQNWDADKAAADKTWQAAIPMLQDEKLNLVVLDELTYMLKYKYLETEQVLEALRNRPSHQSVIITGRGASDELLELADTVSEIRDEKHAYRAGIKAQEGIDY